MVHYLFSNFAEAQLASTLQESEVQLSVDPTDSGRFPMAGGNQVFRATLSDGTQGPEIIEVTANPQTGTMQIVRARESTAAKTWPAGAHLRLTTTAEIMQSITQTAQTNNYISILHYGGRKDDDGFDNSVAINASLADLGYAFLPPGRWRVAETIVLSDNQSLFGVGEKSVFQARDQALNPTFYPGTGGIADYETVRNAIEVRGGYTQIHSLRIVGGATAVKYQGVTTACVKNTLRDVSIWDAFIGIVMDGGDDTNKPCYWNDVSNVLIARMRDSGVLFTITPGNPGDPSTFGDTPNANKFRHVRAYSLSAPMAGNKAGFYLADGRFWNSFTDCEANLHSGADFCFRFGANTDQNVLTNFYAESLGQTNAIQIDSGAENVVIENLFDATGGAAINDAAQGENYISLNAGADTKNFLKKTTTTDLTARVLSISNRLYTPTVGEIAAGPIMANLVASHHVVSAFNGSLEFRLPAASANFGKQLWVIKRDASGNTITVTEDGGNGANSRPIVLGVDYDGVGLTSDGAQWLITHPTENYSRVLFRDTAGTYDMPGTHDVYLLSAFNGNITVRLPVATVDVVEGKRILVKRIDQVTTNSITVEVASGTEPDTRKILLDNPWDWVELICDGNAWYVANTSAVLDNIRTYTSSGTVTPSIWARVHLADCTSGGITLELPAASDSAGRILTIKKTDSSGNAATVTVVGAGTIDGQSSAVLGKQYDYVTVVSSGGGWLILARGPVPFATWTNPTGTGFNRGVFNADDQTSFSGSYVQSECAELSQRLADTRAVLRALVLDLKSAGIFGG